MCLHLPTETSKLMGLSPIFRSIMVASKKAPKSKKSSYFSGTIYREKELLDRAGFLFTLESRVGETHLV